MEDVKADISVEIIDAIIKDDPEKLQELYIKDLNSVHNLRNFVDGNIYHTAVELQATKVIKYLFTTTIDIFHRNSNDRIPFSYAIDRGFLEGLDQKSLEIIRLFMSHLKTDLAKCTYNLLDDLYHGEDIGMALLIELLEGSYGFDKNYFEVHSEFNFMNDVIRDNRLNIVKLLVENCKIDVNKTIAHRCDLYDASLLMMSVEHNSKDIVEYLLSLDSIDIDVVDVFGNKAIHYAVDDLEILKLLMAAGSDPASCSMSKKTLLHFVCQAYEVKVEIIDFLVNKVGLDANARDDCEMTPVDYIRRQPFSDGFIEQVLRIFERGQQT